MASITIKSLAIIGTLVGGFSIFKIGPVVGPINFNRESPLLSEDDEQRARALRIAAERKAEKAAERRADAELEAEIAARQRKLRDETGIKMDFGEVYAFLCKGDTSIGYYPMMYSSMKDPEFVECLSRINKPCPHPRSDSLGRDTWSMRIRDEGWLWFC